MTTTSRATLATLSAIVMILLATAPVLGQHAEGRDHEGADHDMAAHHPNLFADLDEDIAVVKNKLIGLAEAIPAEDYDWRPGEGVRSVRETLLHVAADNYFSPVAFGAEPPESTGISDYPSTQAFEGREISKDAVMEELEASFLHLRRLLFEGDPMSIGEEMSLFGQPSTVQKAWILITTHLHEHLGQMIAYARSNGVAPPWSR